MTNGDKIRGMTDEELARQNVRKMRGYCIWTCSDGQEFSSHVYGKGYRPDKETIHLAVEHEIEWLKQEARAVSCE